MPWKKAPQTIIDLFDAVAPGPPVERRQMFGYPCCFINGNLAAGVYQDTIMLRLSDDQQKVFLKQPGPPPLEPMPGRPMRGYVAAPPSLLADRDALRKWLDVALKHTASLPPKAGKGKTKAKPGKR